MNKNYKLNVNDYISGSSYYGLYIYGPCGEGEGGGGGEELLDKPREGEEPYIFRSLKIIPNEPGVDGVTTPLLSVPD